MLHGQEVQLRGLMGERFSANLEHWLLAAPYANPGMTQMYFRRNQPHQPIVSWYGEFSGKYITSAALTYAMQPDPRLKDAIDHVVGQLALAQDTDGYLGVWPDSAKFVGMTPGYGGKTWDVWAHYHNMLGLYYWHRISGSEQARQVLLHAADCLYNYFVRDGHPLDEAKDGTDAAIGHIFGLLYEKTHNPRYMQMVEYTLQTFASPTGGDYLNAGLQGVPFYQMKRRRWECLHAIQTIASLWRITGEEQYRTAFTNIWRSIRDFDRHNTGGFSSGESACGNPYDTRAIETCCTIAWMALTIDMLQMTDDPTVADELELSTWNALLGAQHPSGRTFTYNTPMIGDRKASAHDIVFQAVAGSSELNCCSVNGPRGFGMIREWGWQQKGDTITINYDGPSTIRIPINNGQSVIVTQEGTYPFGNDITLTVSAPRNYKGVLRLRIPAWSKNTTVNAVNCPTGYITLPLHNKQQVTVHFDMRARIWRGERNLAGTASIYRGPILLASDQLHNNGKTESDTLDLNTLTLKDLTVNGQSSTPKGSRAARQWSRSGLAFESRENEVAMVNGTDALGHSLILCDFASAGQTGTTYTTWFPAK